MKHRSNRLRLVVREITNVYSSAIQSAINAIVFGTKLQGEISRSINSGINLAVKKLLVKKQITDLLLLLNKYERGTKKFQNIYNVGEEKIL